MFRLHRIHRFLLALATVAVSLTYVAEAVADTIYMKNGRVIHSSSVRVEGDRVYFVQFGGEISVPLSAVDRIVEDQNAEPEPTPVAPVPDPSADPETETGDSAEGETDAGAAEGDEAEVVPEQTREFWQDRLRAIDAERGELNLQIEDLRRAERAFLFSHRSTAETRTAIETAQTRLEELDQEQRDVNAEARRLGIPAGWLRLGPPGGATGGDG